MKTIYIIIGVIVAIIIAAFVLSIPAVKQTIVTLFPMSVLNTPPQGTAEFTGHKITLLIAKTDAQKHQGLSDKNSLTQDTGMIFLFDHPDYYHFYMRHMKFPLDIIYINNNKIVTILPNVPNPPYSVENPPVYQPQATADKVIEVPAGFAKKYNVKVGDTVKITL